MSFDEFLDAAKDRVQEALPDAKVTIQQVNKLQGESYTGIAVQPEGASAAVTFNVSPAFERYQEKCQISGLWLARDQIENPIYREQICNWQAHDVK